MHDAPEVDVEQTAVVFLRHFVEPAVNCQPGIIDPSVDSAEPRDRFLCDALDLLSVCDVAWDVDRDSAARIDLVDDLVRRLLAPLGQYELGSFFCRRPSGRQADSAGRAGDDNDLLVQWF